MVKVIFKGLKIAEERHKLAELFNIEKGLREKFGLDFDTGYSPLGERTWLLYSSDRVEIEVKHIA